MRVIRILVGVAALVAAVAGCFSDVGNTNAGNAIPTTCPVVAPTRSSAIQERSAHNELMTYLNSPARNARLKATIDMAGPVVAAYLASGAFGKTDKLNDAKKAMTKSYVGWGSIDTSDRQSGWSAHAEVYWDHGKLDYSKGVTGFYLDAGTETGAAWIFKPNGDPFTKGAVATFQFPHKGCLQNVDDSGLKFTSSSEILYVNTAAEARKLDDKVLETLKKNMRDLPSK